MPDVYVMISAKQSWWAAAVHSTDRAILLAGRDALSEPLLCLKSLEVALVSVDASTSTERVRAFIPLLGVLAALEGRREAGPELRSAVAGVVALPVFASAELVPLFGHQPRSQLRVWDEDLEGLALRPLGWRGQLVR
jgi:hypothetical protein